LISFEQRLQTVLGSGRVENGAPLAPHTTFRVGGPADWLVTIRTVDEIRSCLTAAREHEIPVAFLGGGSNVLVADKGVRGLVLRIHGGDVVRRADDIVRADAGVTINGLVRWTINRGVAGLEAWAGTPGTVGGAVHGNAHFQGRLISELIDRVTLVTPTADVIEVNVQDMGFGYDQSRLQRTGEVVVSADFRVRRGDPGALRAVARESLAFRKRTQPLEAASAGCIFQNPDPTHDRVPTGVPASAGALVDRAGLKGHREGNACVSSTHANFIINDGGATACDIARLIERCKQDVRTRLGVELREEIVRLGEWE
jgi:UDP-N-acetylmuramate dehydrogenase